MNTLTEIMLEKAEDISRLGMLDTLIDRVTRRILPQTTAAAGCTQGSSCRFTGGCTAPWETGYWQYLYDWNGHLCGSACCV